MATQLTLNDGSLNSAGSLLLKTNGTTTAVTIDTSQNLGLGVTPSAWGTSGAVFKVIEYGKVGNSVAGLSSGPELEMISNAYYNSGWKYANTGSTALRFSLNGDTAGAFSWNVAASGTAGNPITFTQAMTLDASGNLGVGTTSPTQKITTNGAIRTTGNSTNFNETGAQIDAYDGMRLCSYISTGSAIQFLTNASGGNTAERARIDSSGNLLVGVTSTVNSSKMFMGFSGGRGFGINDAAGGSGTQVVWFQSAGTQVGSITTTTTATSYNTSSDYRLKNVTGSLTGYKERLSALQPKQGYWKADGSEFRGFLAHDFAVSYPTSVNGEKDAVDADGNPQYQGMQAGSSEVIADLVAYIKELETRLSALEQA